jgi:hypothetical protein
MIKRERNFADSNKLHCLEKFVDWIKSSEVEGSLRIPKLSIKELELEAFVFCVLLFIE